MSTKRILFNRSKITLLSTRFDSCGQRFYVDDSNQPTDSRNAHQTESLRLCWKHFHLVTVQLSIWLTVYRSKFELTSTNNIKKLLYVVTARLIFVHR